MPAALHLAIRQAMQLLDVGVMGQAVAKPLHLRSTRSQWFLKKTPQGAQTAAPKCELLFLLEAWHTTQKGILFDQERELIERLSTLTAQAGVSWEAADGRTDLDVTVAGVAETVLMDTVAVRSSSLFPLALRSFVLTIPELRHLAILQALQARKVGVSCQELLPPLHLRPS